jgi:putative Holliday junction resolvase
LTVLGLDVGDRRIGIAVSDPTELLARPLSFLVRRSNAIDAEAIRRIVSDLSVRTIVVGAPLSGDFAVGPQARKARAFAKFLRRAIGIPVETWDERFSTLDAEQNLIAQNVAKGKRRDRIDSAAAAVILDEWLTAQRSNDRSLRPESSSVDERLPSDVCYNPGQ